MARCAPALRGPRPHARGDTIRTGTGRSLGRLAGVRQAAAGRLRPHSADARPREVRPAHSTGEAAEQTRARTGRGGRGGKGRGRGNRGAAKHGPDAEPGRRVTGAGPRTGSGEAEQAGTVHRADAPHHAGPAGLGLPSARAEGLPGVDGVTWDEYAASLDANIGDLHRRVVRGGYRAKPSRRRYIPKPDGRQRPLGIAALEDKVIQRALAEVLNAIYETDFLGFSYGFRPGRSQHDALDALAYGINPREVNWVLDADIRSFFDRI